jgi:hypothetical protein
MYLHTTSQRDRAVADALNRLLPPNERARSGHANGTSESHEVAANEQNAADPR